MKKILFFVLSFWVVPFSFGQKNALKCTNNAERAWWDVQHYTIHIAVDTASGKISGTMKIKAKTVDWPLDHLQIDLQQPMKIQSISGPNNSSISFNNKRDKETYFLENEIPFSKLLRKGDDFEFTITFEGIPKLAANAPWDGGMVFTKDSIGNPWIAMACQGIGASIWLPCKDFPGDEPDEGMDLFIEIPKGLSGIGNGKLIGKSSSEQSETWHWQVKNPINNYDISFYIGEYAQWKDTFQGEKGILDLDYFVLPEELEKAKVQFQQVKQMLTCFEEKLGPYPFYEDGYKIVQAPYLGMEHQSAVAYGNHFQNGYLGKDRSNSRVGLLFDFIIIHESAHEWFGNSITAKDKADMWIQEGFATYAETIFAECIAGKEAALNYQHGKRTEILNDKPVIGAYESCDEGSSDHYDKAAFLIHMIRFMMQDDGRFFAMLRSMNKTFYHKTVTGDRVVSFIRSYNSDSISLAFFDQYLMRKDLPVLELKRNAKKDWEYRWVNCVPGFAMSIPYGTEGKWIHPNMNAFKKLPTGQEPDDINNKDFLFDILVIDPAK